MNEGTGNGKFFEALNGLISGLKKNRRCEHIKILPLVKIEKLIDDK